MPRSQIEADLREAQQDRARLDTEIERLSTEREQVQVEEQLLAQVLRLHQFSDNGSPEGTETTENLTISVSDDKKVSVSANVLAVVQQSGGAAVTPRQVLDVLGANGIQSDLNAIRVALRRWSDRGRIIKDGHVYRARPDPATLIQEDRQ